MGIESNNDSYKIDKKSDILNNVSDYINSSIVILQNRYTQLRKISESIEEELKKFLTAKKYGSNIVQSRIKDISSLPEKIYRKNYFYKFNEPVDLINNLPDLIGVRILCLLNNEEEEIYNELKVQYKNIKVFEQKDYFFCDESPAFFLALNNQPESQKNGEAIYRISGKWKDEDNEINFELQIKSMVHYFWGELEHLLFYKNYSALLSQGFYSQYMQEINGELENLDKQLTLLKKQIKKSNADTIKEIREIACFMLFKNYYPEVERRIACKIDLRESFELLNDVYFENYGSQEQNIRKLEELIKQIRNKSFRQELIDIVITGKLAKRNFSDMEYRLAQHIDSKIKSGDVYWIFFVVIYSSCFVTEDRDDYDFLLRKICEKLIRIVEIQYTDDIEYINDDLDSIYDSFKDSILKGIFDVFEQNSKIDFFLIEGKLSTIRDISVEIVRSMQLRLEDIDNKTIEINMLAVELYTYYRIANKLKLSILEEKINKLNEILPNIIFDINLDENNLSDVLDSTFNSSDKTNRGGEENGAI